jgi:NAD(P)-dependent dehydrogenase (short-subunit alcohol dehydrogenase family)
MTKQYLIIGGSSGIGFTLAENLSKKGNLVIAASRRSMSANGISHLPFNVLTDDLPLNQLPDKLDGLVYCPGSINLKPFHRLTDQDYREDFELNVLGAVKTLRSALPLLKNSAHASVVFFSTVAVGQGMPFHASVAAAKGALEGFTKSVAAELAPKIRVNCIAPSLTNTPLASKLLSSDDKLKASGDRHPLKRVGETDDIAKAAEFLLSEDSSWMTGQIMHIDGGLSTLRI